MSVTLDDFLFKPEQIGQRWLVLIKPDGTVATDGGHEEESAVAKALYLHNSISIIRPPIGTRAFMVTIEEVPSFKGRVNETAIRTLNTNTP